MFACNKLNSFFGANAARRISHFIESWTRDLSSTYKTHLFSAISLLCFLPFYISIFSSPSWTSKLSVVLQSTVWNQVVINSEHGLVYNMADCVYINGTCSWISSKLRCITTNKNGMQPQIYAYGNEGWKTLMLRSSTPPTFFVVTATTLFTGREPFTGNFSPRASDDFHRCRSSTYVKALGFSSFSWIAPYFPCLRCIFI